MTKPVSSEQAAVGSLNKEQIEIMKHTAYAAAGAMYCGDSPDMQQLVKAGLMVSCGKKSFVPDEYFRMTAKGNEYLLALMKKGSF
jgi:hypothetical protein